GSAIKATHCTVNCTDYNIYKAPKTDDGTKNSIKGLPFVYKEDGKIKFRDQVTTDMFESPQNMLKVVFRNGQDLSLLRFQQIRDNVSSST
ncbi:MAG: nicotinate phosphoribosyltransferase, partial [Alphaproteobacteria bacterium]|nr:nicotinate phosphoribosyltransferase [Alphaproteobacteria bacterium]